MEIFPWTIKKYRIDVIHLYSSGHPFLGGHIMEIDLYI